MKCGDVMTMEVTCCLPTDSLEEVASVMQSEDIGPVPIVDDLETRNLIGIVTDRDIALRAVARGLDARNTPAGEIMTREVVSVRPATPVRQVAALMDERRIHRVLVLDEENRLHGLISALDIVRLYAAGT